MKKHVLAFLLLGLLAACSDKKYVFGSYSTMRYEAVALPAPADTAELTAVDFISTTEGFVGGHNGTLLVTTDAGRTWTNRSYPGIGTINKLVFSTPTQGWACTSYGLYRTNNGGQGWQEVDNGTISGAVYDVQFVTPQIGYTAGESIYKTTDGGQNWTDQGRWPNPLDPTRALWFTSPDSGMAVGKERIRYTTTDGGRTWGSHDGSAYTKNWCDVVTFPNGAFVVVGDDGFFEYRTESSYSYYTPDKYATFPIYGLAYWAPLKRVVAVGENSIIRRHPEFTQQESTPWVYVQAPDGSSIQRTFFAADFADANTFYAVGTAGTLFRFYYQ